MLIITTIYYVTEAVRKPNAGRITDREESQLKSADRKIVTVYQGSSRE